MRYDKKTKMGGNDKHMSTKTTKENLQLYDKRIIQKNIEQKLLLRKEYEVYLKSLRDESSRCESVRAESDFISGGLKNMR